MTNNFRRNDLVASTIADLAITLLGDVGCQIYAHDHGFFAHRAENGWCAAEIARSFVRANFAKSNPLRRRFLTALTKHGAGPVSST